MENLNIKQQYKIESGENAITIVNLFCQLGNQLFHFAFLLYLRNIYKNKRSCYLHFRTPNENNEELLQAFPSLINFIVNGSDLANMNNRSSHFVNELQDSKVQLIQDRGLPMEFYNGYWQCWQYPAKVENELRKYLKFNLNALNSYSESCLQKINQSFSISLHIRRGDYEQDFSTRLKHGRVCTEYYYKKAIEYFSNEFCSQKIIFFVFSDDIEWAKNSSLLTGHNAIFVNWNRDKDAWQDICLMSNCKHHIIANSSFSWWGAWLNPLPEKKVIAPETWYNTMEAPDLLPLNWIQMPVEPLSSNCSFEGLTVIIPINIDDEADRKCLSYIEPYFCGYKKISVIIVCLRKEQALIQLDKNPIFSIIETGVPYSYTQYVNQAVRLSRTKYLAIWNVYSYISPLQFETAWLQIKEDNYDVVYPYNYGVLSISSNQFEDYILKKDFRAILSNDNINAKKAVGLDSIVLLMTKSIFLSLNYDNELIGSIRYAAMERNKRIEHQNLRSVRVQGWLYTYYNDTEKLMTDSKEDLKIFIKTCRRLKSIPR